MRSSIYNYYTSPIKKGFPRAKRSAFPQRRDLTTFKKLSNLWPYLATTSFWVATPLSVITSTM